jgi:hypothetical protein
VKKWHVQVWQDFRAAPVHYFVYATSGWDARTLAFALDGGFPKAMTEMDASCQELIYEYTKIIAST